MSNTRTAGAAGARRRLELRFVLLLICGLQASMAAMGQERAYIPNAGSATVSVIDVATNTVVSTIPVGNGPTSIAAAADGQTVYATHRGHDRVVVIDVASEAVVATINVGRLPNGLALSPDGARLYVANYDDDSVSVIDTAAGNVVSTVLGVGDPVGLTVTPDGQSVYVTRQVGSDVAVIDADTLTVTQIPVGGSSNAVLMDPVSPRAYVATSGSIRVIDTTTQVAIDTWASGLVLHDLAISPDGARLYLSDTLANSLVVVDTSTGAMIGAPIAVGSFPIGVDVTADGSLVYVINMLSNTVSVVNATTRTVVDTVPVGNLPQGYGSEFISTFVLAPPEGVNLSTPTAPVTYAEEIIATPGAPVTLDNPAGDLNLTAALGYSFSPDETRYARFECPGAVFAADATAEYAGGGSASVGAINGLNSQAIHFSITADDADITADGVLTVTGGRRITGNESVDCTYGLYDFPSQAASGGSIGRVATVGGAYLEFAPSTTFASSPLTAVADVEADPAFSAFVPGGPTTGSTAALAELAYGLAAPAPLKADGIPVTLDDLDATGADGTRIVAEGDFSAVANADGSFTGAARDRVYLSGDDASCTLAGGIAASALDATQAQFPVGATATDTLLCLVPLDGTPIPVADYTARLLAVSADPATYTAHAIGPLDAGAIIRNGAQLQAPLVQVPEDWVSRVALTNTGGIDRPYVIAVMGEPGNAIGTANLTGVVPARGTVVIDLEDVLVSFSGQPWATLTVTVAGPNAQIQGVYQIVNPANGSISNETMVRPGTN